MDHWKLLADELGAEVTAEEQAIAPDTESADVMPADAPSASDEDVATTEEPLPPPVVKAVLPPRSAPARRTTSDWSQLAAELGIEVPPEPEPEPIPPTPEEPVAAVTEEPDLGWRGPSPVRPPESRPEHRREEPRRPAGEAGREEDRRGRGRRRRRRRPFEDGERQGVAAGPSSEPAAAEDDLDMPFSDSEAEFGEPEPSEPVASEGLGDDAELLAPSPRAPSPSRGEDGGRGRGKRRRRRKGTSRRESPAAGEEAAAYERSGAGAAAPAGPPSDRKEAEPADDFDIADEDFAADEDAESEPRSDKSLHRAIPSWFDAVNVVVSANLESRAKSPDRRPSGRSRGGHDRRGRDRGGERPK